MALPQLSRQQLAQKWTCKNINVMPLRPGPAATLPQSGAARPATTTGTDLPPWRDGSKAALAHKRRQSSATRAWRNGPRAAMAQRRGEGDDDEFAAKGAVPTMGSALSTSVSRRGLVPSGRGRTERFEDFRLSRTISLDAMSMATALLRERSRDAGGDPRIALRLGGAGSTSSHDLSRVWCVQRAPSPRATTPSEARDQAMCHLQRGIGIVQNSHVQCEHLWNQRPPMTRALSGIVI